MTLMNWISIGVTAALAVTYIVLRIYAKHITNLYDGLGGIITRRRIAAPLPQPGRKTSENDTEGHNAP